MALLPFPIPSPPPPLLLLMIHHEETQVNANRNRNRNPKGARKCNSAWFNYILYLHSCIIVFFAGNKGRWLAS